MQFTNWKKNLPHLVAIAAGSNPYEDVPCGSMKKWVGWHGEWNVIVVSNSAIGSNNTSRSFASQS